MGVLKNRTETLQKKIHQQKYNLDFEEVFMAQVAKQQDLILKKIHQVLNDFNVQCRYQMKQQIKKIDEEKAVLIADVQESLAKIQSKFKDPKSQASDQLQVQLKTVENKLSSIQKFKDNYAQFEFIIDQGNLMQALQKLIKFKVLKNEDGQDSKVKSVFPKDGQDEEEEEEEKKKKAEDIEQIETEIPLNNQYLLQYIQATQKLQVYNIQNLSVNQKQVENFVFPQLAASCMLGNHAYIVGGLLSFGNFVNQTIRINTDAKVSTLTKMLMPRSSFPITFNKDSSGLKNRLLIVSTGGHSSCGLLKDCEVYDVRSNKWNSIPKMKQGRQLHASCLIEDYNICFVFSGQISPYNFITSVEKISINCQSESSAYHSGQWQKIEMAESILGDFRLCAIYCKDQSKILLFGGGEEQKKAYKLDCQSGQIVDKFQECSLIPSPYYCSVFGFNEGMIYCVGYGNDSFQALPQLFKWNGSDWSQQAV